MCIFPIFSTNIKIVSGLPENLESLETLEFEKFLKKKPRNLTTHTFQVVKI